MRRASQRALAAMLVAAGVAAPLALSAAAQVTLRGREQPEAGEVRAVDAQGVTLWTGPAERDSSVISWDRVASVNDPKAAAFAEVSRELWRARTRLARGDVVSAEPILERQFVLYASGRGPTSAMIAEGLLRARLARGATAAAVTPWLVFLACGAEPRITRDERHAPGGYLETPALPIDEETGLIPALPPIWLRGQASAAFARSALQGISGSAPETAAGTPRDEEREAADQKSAALGALYQAAAAFENDIGASMPDIPASLRTDKTVRLVTLIVAARITEDPVRTAARKELERELTLAAAKPWLEAWLRVAIARSLARDASREARLLAVGQLAHLPARLADGSAFLTGLALADMAIEMNEMGDTAAALTLRDELVEFAPDHPALETEPIRRWPKARAAETGGT